MLDGLLKMSVEFVELLVEVEDSVESGLTDSG